MITPLSPLRKPHDKSDPIEIIRQAGHALIAFAELHSTVIAEDPDRLVELSECTDLATVRQLKAMIAKGALSASKPKGSRAYKVRRADVEALFAPKPRLVESKKRTPRSEGEKIAANLRAAGVRGAR